MCTLGCGIGGYSTGGDVAKLLVSYCEKNTPTFTLYCYTIVYISLNIVGILCVEISILTNDERVTCINRVNGINKI